MTMPEEERQVPDDEEGLPERGEGEPEPHLRQLGLKTDRKLPLVNAYQLAKLEKEIQRRRVLYRQDGLEALHDLCMMPITDSASKNQLKYLAASRLAELQAETSNAPTTDMEVTLRTLNESYKQHAPRIKSVRERVIEFEQPPQ